MGLYSVCSILKDAKYDLTTNVSVADGMSNGAECIIKKIDYRVPVISDHQDQALGFYFTKNTWGKIIAKNILILQPNYRQTLDSHFRDPSSAQGIPFKTICS